MLYTYGGSFQGRSHIERKVVCQDSSINKIVEINGRKYAVLIAADGVGSAKHAEDVLVQPLKSVLILFRIQNN